VLRHADVFVTQGGIGSMMEALAEGVPLVLSPRNGEQRVNAARAVELGLGALLPDEPDPAALRDAVAAATTDVGVRERVAAMRGAIARAGGARAAADAITGG
jgi:UDP:flavonoid glycosyltransferase YjiC (YdhE family)